MSKPRFPGSFWHGVLLGGAALLVVGLLWQGLSQPPPAYGQVPDSGAQRERMITQMELTNQNLTKVVNLLKQIRDKSPDDSSAKKPPKPSGRPQDPPPGDPRWP